jgi:hypothetical protein
MAHDLAYRIRILGNGSEISPLTATSRCWLLLVSVRGLPDRCAARERHARRRLAPARSSTTAKVELAHVRPDRQPRDRRTPAAIVHETTASLSVADSDIQLSHDFPSRRRVAGIVAELKTAASRSRNTRLQIRTMSGTHARTLARTEGFPRVLNCRGKPTSRGRRAQPQRRAGR